VIIKLINDDRRFNLPMAMIKNLMAKVAASAKCQGALIIIFINDQKMADLNFRYKGKNKPTDVLAFSLADNKSRKYIEGEIYIDLQMAKRQAQEFSSGYHEEIIRLCIHGMLHLLGYDDHEPREKRKMWRIQEAYLRGNIDGEK
jgi:probable rRNA maturation factor